MGLNSGRLFTAQGTSPHSAHQALASGAVNTLCLHPKVPKHERRYPFRSVCCAWASALAPGASHTTCPMCVLDAAPPEALRAKASVIADLGFPPPSSGAVKHPGPLCVFLGQRHPYRFPLGPGVPRQLWGGVGSRAAGGQGPTPGELGTWSPAAVSTVSSCLQMFFKASGPRPLTQPPAVAGPDSQPPEREITDCFGRGLGAVTPASNYRFSAHYSSHSCRD